MKLLLKKKKSSGFTLVETLVAISILMLAVTGPLYFASSSLKAATYARDQITAFYLAQDAFEQIREIRDSNLITPNGDWLNGILSSCSGPKGCEVGLDNGFNTVIASCDSVPCSSLLLSDTGFYNYITGTATPFTRTIFVQKTTDQDEAKVTVTISWKSGTVDRNFTAYEFLRNLNPST